MKGSESSHALVIPVLSTSVIQHANDLNNWIPKLEEDRQYKHTPIKVPTVESVQKKDYDQQIGALSKLLDDENKNFDKLLAERITEATEIVSVAAGKRKKREKTKEEIAGGYESLSESEEEKQHVEAKKDRHDKHKKHSKK